MQGAKFTLSLLALLCASFFVSAQQQASKSKSADKLYEKGELNTNVIITNTTLINSPQLEFSPAFYQNGMVFVTSRYKSGPKDKKIGETFMELFYAELDGNGMPLDPQDFSVNLNSQRHEGPVSFSRSGDVIYFTRNNMEKGMTRANSKGRSVLKIYEAKRGTYDWEDIKELPFNSDDYRCTHPSLSANGTVLYFSSDMEGGYGGMDLYMVERRADTWSKPINLGSKVNTSGNEIFPYIHESGTLFFSSTGHGGYGGLDLYMVETSGRGDVQVKNLGIPFNSPTDDLGLIINEAGTRGYFSSNREGGLGKDDIYLFEAAATIVKEKSVTDLNSQIIVYDESSNERISEAAVRIFERASDGFLEGNDLYDVQLLPVGETGELVMKLVRKNPEELGAPNLATNANGEAIYQMKGDKSYMILVTKDGFENAEIMYSTVGETESQTVRIPMKPKACANMAGVVSVERFNTRVPNALVRIFNECTGTEDLIRANSNGEFEACLPLGCNYTVYAEKEGYVKGLSKASTITGTNTQRVEIDVQLTPIADNILKEPIREGSVIVLKEIYYDFDKSAIRRGAARELDALINLMHQYPSMEIELVAHTDSRGDENYNLDLSLRRAESAKKYLMRNGISDQRIKAFGYGEAQVLNHCVDNTPCSDTEHQFNRRTEVKITKIDEPIKVQYEDGSPFDNKGRMD